MENTLQDFKEELKKTDFPFKEFTKGHEDYLFDEFKELRPQPKVELYIADKMDLDALSKELMNVSYTVSGSSDKNIAANFVSTGILENKYIDLKNEFYSLSRQVREDLEEKYYGRYLNGIPTISKLNEIDNKIKLLTDYVLKHSNIDNYRDYAKTAAKVINKLLDGMPFRNEIITKILEKESPLITIKFMFKECSEEAHGRYCEMIDILSEFVNADIKNTDRKDLSNIFNGQPLSEVRESLKILLKKGVKGKEIFTEVQLDNFIKRAFCGHTDIDKIEANTQSNRGSIGKVFYSYWEEINQKDRYFSSATKNPREDYAKLISENIKGFTLSEAMASLRRD